MPEKPEFSLKQTLHMRKNFIGKSCKLHFEAAPLKLVRASRQYLYDDSGQEYLDCVNSASHVGHCHPHVVGAGQDQMARLSTSSGFLNEQTTLYARHLISKLPESLCISFFLSSGSEANDLALRLAAAYTKKHDVICLDGAYHGNLGTLVEISPVRFRKLGSGHQQKDWVHIAPSPNTFRGKYLSDTQNPGLLYAKDLMKVFHKAEQSGRQIGAFISEPVISASGMVVPPENYFQTVYRYVREQGGVCISDEVQAGLGRCGEHFWGFQLHNVVPDIVTIGKPVGNGFPLAAVITTKEIADSLMDFTTTFGGNPVACAIGKAVLEVIENEKLASSAKNVGKCLIDGFKAAQSKHSMMGDVRGIGMLVGIELVMDKESKKPAKEAAEILAYKMKERKIIVGIEGYDKNVIVFTPPLCFTTDNARHLLHNFLEILTNIENDAARVGLTSRDDSNPNLSSGGHVPLDVITDQPTISIHTLSDDDDDDEECAAKRARYEEVD